MVQTFVLYHYLCFSSESFKVKISRMINKILRNNICVVDYYLCQMNVVVCGPGKY